MQKFNRTEKLAYEVRQRSINNEKPVDKVVWKLMYLGQAVFNSDYYHFCKAEMNRLIASGYYNKKNFTITK